MSGGVGPEREARLAEIQRRAEIGVITTSEYIAWLLAELEAAEKALREIEADNYLRNRADDWERVVARHREIVRSYFAGSAARTESER